MRVQRYDFFLNHQNFSKKKSLFSCIFYALLIYVNTQNDLHLIIYYIGRAVLAKSQEQRTELQTQEKPSTPFWLVISSILLFTGCAAGILFIKKRGSPRNSTTYCKNRTKTQSIDNKQFTLVCLLFVYSLFIDYLIFPALKFGSEPRNNYFCNMNINLNLKQTL